jgi:F-type H+-transporting ATPase subunit gamma
MVSAAKLRRAQERVLAARPYASMFRKVLGDLACAVAADLETPLPLLAQRPESRVLLIVLTADRGLAGAFNSNLIRSANQFMAGREPGSTSLVVVGRKGRDFWRKRGANILSERTGISATASYDDASGIAKEIAGAFEREEVDAVYLLYNEFKSVVSQKLTMQRVLPMELPKERREQNYIYEQPPEELIGKLLVRYVDIAIYQAILESAASEQAARMTAMEAATSNAGEMIDKLTLYMNRVRQASITTQIIEVVSGAAAAS